MINALTKAEGTDRSLMGENCLCCLDFQSEYMQEIRNSEALNKLLDAADEIDFLLSYYNDEKMTNFIIDLREKVNGNGNNLTKSEMKEAKRTLKKLDPTYEIKAAIIIEDMLTNAKGHNYGIGSMNEIAYLFNCRYWEEMPIPLITHFLSAYAEKCGLYHHQATKVKFQEHMLKQFHSTAIMPAPKINQNAVMINLQNGTFVCKDGAFSVRAFNAKDRLTYQLPFEYNQNAKAPKFMKFLEEVLPEENARKVVAEYIGYVFAKNLRWEKVMVLFGSGKNGKSVLMDIITALLGRENVCSFSLKSLSDSTGYYRAELERHLLNACSEMGADKSDPNIVKQLISNDPVSARSPYGRPITIHNYCRFLFNTNLFSNKDMEQTHGYFRRFIVVEFNVTIPDHKVNTNLAKEIINEELSGVFNWVLDGLSRILEVGREGFTKSAHIDSACARVERESNNVAIFIDECDYVSTPDQYTPATQLFADYKEFCEDCGFRTVSRMEFIRRLEKQLKIGVKRKATNNATWVYCTKRAKQQVVDLQIEKMFNL